MNNITKVKNIFITGAIGFIGRHLLTEFTDEHFFVYALSRNDGHNNAKNIQYIKGDLFGLSEFSETLSTIDYFIHIAGEKNDEKLMYEVNVKGVSVILSEIVKYPNIKFLQVSSAGVYGIEEHPETVLTENTIVHPNNTYEKTKYEAEQIVMDAGLKAGMNYSIIRPSNVFGENDKGRKLLNLCKAVSKNRFFYINPHAKVNYVYVKQVTHTIKQLIEKDIFENKIYNINAPCNIFEFIDIIKNTLHIKNKTRHIPMPFSLLIKITGKIADLLPVKYQFINSGKYRELTSEKFYSTDELRKKISVDETKFLNTGIHNLVNHYKEEGLL